ncbi:hypothetical protein ABKP09_02785 [Peribacillus frigoritolerans]|uniref:hypothetical protein n=1 Tax=Peribacillus frigoritolerans TaxID=450367 RepID=UPI0032B59A91
MENTNSPTLKRTLTLKYVVFFGLAFMAPKTFFSTYGVAVNSTSGMMPTAYAIALGYAAITESVFIGPYSPRPSGAYVSRRRSLRMGKFKGT